MGTPLEQWESIGIHDVTLKDGTNVGLRLPSIPDCIIAGGIPMPVVNRLKDEPDAQTPEPSVRSLDDLKHDVRYRAEMIRSAVATFEGQPLDLTVEDVVRLPEEHREEIFEYASRKKPLDPKAE